MKLRIRGNSIRLRLSPDDLATLVRSGAVEDSVSFPGGQRLRYRLESARADEGRAELAGPAIIVQFPDDEIARWARPQEVAMRAEQPLADGSRLLLLVEKDFECLAPRNDDDENAETLYPNPRAAGDGT